jgi:basic membrane protein A
VRRGKSAQDGKPAGGARRRRKTTLVGLVLDRAARTTKSFNTAAFDGAELAVKEGGIELKDVETMDDALFEPNLARHGGEGVRHRHRHRLRAEGAAGAGGAAFPNTHFAIVDATVDLPNVASLLFDAHRLLPVGAIAAASTQTGTIGFVGGMDIPLIRRFEMGYVAGEAGQPEDPVLPNFVGVTSDAWNNPTRGKELATSQYQRGATSSSRRPAPATWACSTRPRR